MLRGNQRAMARQPSLGLPLRFKPRFVLRPSTRLLLGPHLIGINPRKVLFELTSNSVTYRLTYSKPSARRNKSRYGRSPFRTASGTPTTGSITDSPLPFQSVSLFTLFHALP